MSLHTFLRWVLLSCTLALTGQSLIAQDSEKEGSYHPKAADLVIQGAILELQDEYEKALNAYNEALIYEPNSASIAYAVAKDYVLLGKLETAIQMLKRSIVADGAFLESRHLLATIYHRKGDIDLAREQYLAIIDIDSANVDAHLNLGAIYLSEKEHQKAAYHYQQLVKMEEADSEIHFQLGNLYFQEKQYDLAYKAFKNFVDAYPELEQGYLAIGAVLIAREDTTGAINWYQNVYAENPEFTSVRDELANAFVIKEDWDSAIGLFAKDDTTDVLSLLRLGELYLAKGDTGAAVQALEQVAEIDAKEWRGYYRLGQMYLSDNRFPESIPYFEKTVQLNNSLADPWFKLGAAYEQAENFDKAEESYRAAQKLAPQYPWINFYLGNLLLRQNRTEEAIVYITKSVESEPDNAAFVSTLASAYDAIADHEKSEEFYVRALELDPENPTILNNFSYSLAQRKERLDDALSMARKAIETEPENGAFLDTIGWVYYQLDDYLTALEYIKKSVAVRDGSAEVFEHLGDCYDKLGEPQLATQYWKQARELDPERESLLIKLGIN